MADNELPFWKRKKLTEMTLDEWESLCDGCAKCCLHKLEYDDQEYAFTNVACHLLDTKTCKCSNYQERTLLVPDCVELMPRNLPNLAWMPPTCAYLLIHQGKDLPDWHPLVSGDPDSVRKAGISAHGRILSERDVDDLEDHIVDWPADTIEQAAKRNRAANVRVAKLNMQRDTISLAGREIPLVVRRNAHARRVVLRIDVEAGGIALTLPGRTALAEGLALAHERADWVIRCLDKLPARITFADGAIVPLLGRDIVLRHAPGTRHGVQRTENELFVSGAAEHLPRRVSDWLKREAKREIAVRAEPMAERIQRTIAGLTVRDTRSRWGSCTPDGKLSFCWRLILTPEWVLDYVVAHEVAHLAHLNHGPKFWQTVKSLGVKPEQARAWLDVHAERLQRIG